MEGREILLARSSERDPSVPSAWMERAHDRHEILIAPLHPEEHAEGQPQPLTATARAFLAQYVSPAVLEVFPEWQGILIEFPALQGAVWVVHDPQDGQQLISETGKPAILLDAMLAPQGRTLKEMREALTPLLLIPAEKEAQRKPRSPEKQEDKRLTMQRDTAAKTAGAMHGNEGVGGYPHKGGKI